MAGKRIRALTEATAMADSDVLALDNGSVSEAKKITKANMLAETTASILAKEDTANKTTVLSVPSDTLFPTVNAVNTGLALKLDKDFIPFTEETVIVDTDVVPINTGASVLKKLTFATIATWLIETYTFVLETVSQTIKGAIDELFTISKKYSGFENRTDSTITIDGAGVLTIAPAVTSFNVYTNGTGKHTISVAQSVTITDDQTITYVYFDSTGTIQKSTTPWTLTSGVNAPCAIVFKDSTVYAVTDERHSYERNRSWHNWAHFNIGAMYKSGFTSVFTDTTLSVAQGVVADEDIEADSGGTKTTCSIWYRNATTGMRLIRNSTTPYRASVGVLQYDNGSGTLQPVTNNRYSTQWVFATNDAFEQIYVVVGQNNSTTLSDAQNTPKPTINLSTAEWKLIYRGIYRNVGGVATFIEAADFRTVQTGVPSSAITTDHASLINRDALNSHPSSAISYDGTISELTSTTVKLAIDEANALSKYSDTMQNNIALADLSDTITNNAMVYQTGTGIKNGILLSNPVSFKDSGEIVGMKGSTKIQMIGKGNFTGVVVGTDWKNYGTHVSLAVGTGAAVCTPVAQYDGIKQDVAGKTIPIISSHKYYVQITASVASTTKQLAVRLFASDGVTAISTLTNFSAVTTTTRTVYTALVTATATSSTAVFTIQDTSASAFVAITVDDVMMFDLTDELGAGNEPTALAYSSTVTSYFDNKISVLSPVLNTMGKNIFDRSTATADSRINYTTGSVEVAVGYLASAHMRVLPSTSYYGTSLYTSTPSGLAFYDANGTFISGSLTVVAITTPSNAYTLRVTVATANAYIAQVEKGTVATTYESYKTNVLSTTETLRSARDTYATTQLMANGNFVNTGGWFTERATATASGNTYFLTGNGTGASSDAYKALSATTIIGRKYYYKIRARVTNSDCQSIRGVVGGSLQIIQSNPVINTWYTLSFVTTATVATTIFAFYQYYVDSATQNGKVMEVQEAIAYDLTATFGVGLEPTATQVDSTIAYFEGAGTLYLNSIVQDYLYNLNGIWKLLRNVDTVSGLKIATPTTTNATVTGIPYIYQGGTSYFTTTTISPTVVEKIPYDFEASKLAKATNITAINDAGIADGEIMVANLTNKDVRTSNVTITTTLGADDTTVPTSGAIVDAGYMTDLMDANTLTGVGALSVYTCTAAEFAAIAVKPAGTLYIVK